MARNDELSKDRNWPEVIRKLLTEYRTADGKRKKSGEGSEDPPSLRKSQELFQKCEEWETLRNPKGSAIRPPFITTPLGTEEWGHGSGFRDSSGSGTPTCSLSASSHVESDVDAENLLKSFLPDVRQMSSDSRRKFRRVVMDNIDEILGEQAKSASISVAELEKILHGDNNEEFDTPPPQAGRPPVL